jgi:hypothetical protein
VSYRFCSVSKNCRIRHRAPEQTDSDGAEALPITFMKNVYELEVFRKEFMATKYVTESDQHGWLDVRIDGLAHITSLPYACMVDARGVDPNNPQRELFTVLEGIRKGMSGSVRLTSRGTSQFGTNVNRRGPASVKFNRSTGLVTVGGLSMKAITDQGNPVPYGKWKLQIPDEKHPGGHSYFSRSNHATTWFRIMDGRDRYLHPGARTAGCVTVTEVEKWTSICELLTISRLGDGMHVGTIEVVR